MIEKRDAEQMMRAAEGAAPFVENSFYERLLELRETKPDAFSSLSPAAQSALSYYEAAKRRAQMFAAEKSQEKR